jgi:hypothetical protein
MAITGGMRYRDTGFGLPYDPGHDSTTFTDLTVGGTIVTLAFDSGVGLPSVPPSAVVDVSVFVRAFMSEGFGNPTGSNTLRLKYKTFTLTTFTPSSNTPPGDLGFNPGAWNATNPETGVAWTLAEIFSPNWTVTYNRGAGGAARNIGVLECYLVIDYTMSGVTVAPTSGGPGDVIAVSGNGLHAFIYPGAIALTPPTQAVYISDRAVTPTYADTTVTSPDALTFVVPAGWADGVVTSLGALAFDGVGADVPYLFLTGVFTKTSGPSPTWWFWDSAPFIDDLDIGPFYWYGVPPPPFPGWDDEDAIAPSPDGWFMSTAAYGGSTLIIAGGRPKNPRTWTQFAGFATGSAAWLGGSPGIAVVVNNRMVYAATDYTIGTTYPPIRIYDGSFDRELCRLPPTAAAAIPKGIVSMLAANGTIYVATWDSGTTSADWVGRVFSLDVTTATFTPIGDALATGHLPYALAWHNGMLWVGTHRQAASAGGRIYRIRPGIDTAWTLDADLTAPLGVAALLSWQGSLYAGLTAPAGTFGKVWKRTSSWAAVETGSGGAATANNGYLAFAAFRDALYASFWNNDATAVATIRKTTDGTTWTTAYTGASATLRPFHTLFVDNGELFAIGGTGHLTAAIVRTDDGTTWTDLTAEIPETGKTMLPAVAVLSF